MGANPQEGGGEPTFAAPSELPSIPPMVYQPPPNATHLNDFIPPGAIVIPVPVQLPGGPLTPTFPLPLPILEPPLSPTIPVPLPSPSATVTPLPTIPSLPTVEPTVTPPISLPLPIPLNGTITNVVSFDQGQLAVVVEANTVVANSQLLFTALPVPDYPLTATNSISDPVGSLRLMHFQLDMLQEGRSADDFGKPVRIVLDMRALTNGLNPIYEGNYFLAYEDENEPGLWHEVPITVHQDSGLISAEVTHFSTWVGGSRPERWNPSLVKPTVSAFSGAATYHYPMDVPPGRNGLQPGLSLSYNSRALDGAIQDLEAGDIANGWSLAQIAIMRQGVKVKDWSGPLYIYHPDVFSLVLNGTSYELKPDGNSVTNGTIRFYAKDAPGLKVWRYYNSSLDTDGLYWVVTTADGVQYRLGYTADSEEYQKGTLWDATALTHWGKSNNRSAIAWNVDTVTDPFGNQMQYDYFTNSQSETVSYRTNSGVKHSITFTTYSSRLQLISYNYPNTVSSLPATNNVVRLMTTPATTIRLRATSDINPTFKDPISHILIFHNNNNSPIKEYRISSEAQQVPSSGCSRAGSPRNTTTHVVTAISLHTNTDGQVSTQDMGYALPPVTFDYTSLVHYVHPNVNPDKSCFYFRYLEKVYTGYGGKTTFTYTSDNRDVGGYEYYSGTDKTQWPEIGHNYYVTQVEYDDGRNDPVKTTYDYTTPCYDQTDSGVNRCNTSTSPQYGNIVGFATTTQTNYDYNGSTILNKQTTTFSQNANNTIGRPTQVDFMNSSSTLLSRTDYSYTTESIGGIANMFSYNSQTVSTQYQSGLGSAALSSKVVYAYDPVYQGNTGTQYGNLTHIYEYDDAAAATPYRTTRHWYYPNSSGNYWLVNHVGATGVYQGNGWTHLSARWTYYDGNSSHQTAPTQGAVTRSRQLLTDNENCNQISSPPPGCIYLYLTAESSYGYDSYGNQTHQYGSNEYHYQAFDNNWIPIPGSAPATETTTQISYETDYHLYPVQVTLSGTGFTSQTTTFQVYGFNGVGLTGFQEQRGTLKQVTEANGITTKYEYDPFGRLYAVYDGYDNFAGFDDTDTGNGDPVSRYLYLDNNWTHADSFLDPANDKPFFIHALNRPGSYATNSSSSGYAFAEETFYDGFGRPIQNRSIWNWLDGQSKSRDIYSSTAYHANGQVNCQTMPYDLAYYLDRGLVWPDSPFDPTSCTSKPRTTTTYDALARPDITTAPDGTTTNQDYAILNNVPLGGYNKLSQSTTYDAHNHRRDQFSNALGQLVAVREYSGTASPYTLYSTTIYGYDTGGNLTGVTDNANNSTTMTYDHFGRKTAMSDPDMGNWSYIYDAAGNMTEQLDANLDRLCFTYDNLNRLTDKLHDYDDNGCLSNNTILAQYLYFNSGGGLGHPSEIRWTNHLSHNLETFAYDSLGRLTSHTRKVDDRSYTMSYSGFDPFHRPTTVTYPNGQTLTTSYDHEGPNSLSNSGTSLINDIRYNVRGQITLLDRTSGGIDTTYLYHPQHDELGGGTGDSNYRLKTIQHGGGGTGNPWPDFTYEYDKVGNITKLTTVSSDGTDTQTFGYDHLNRLTSASASGLLPTYSDTYVYNAIGNITSFDGVVYSYSSVHKHAVASANGVSYSYDANGNMTLRDASGTVNDYVQNFNEENELTSVVNNGSTTSFTYDAAGIRVKTVAPNGTVTDFPFPGYEVENATGTPTVRLTFSIAGQAVALRVMGSGIPTTFYLYNDHLGSVSKISTTAGGAVSNSTARYYPFGNWRTEPTAGLTDMGYTGHRHNNLGNAPDDIGLIYMNARWYLPGVGRFISADTIVPSPTNPQTWNRYSYVNNNPIRFTDPSGHCAAEGIGGGGQCTPIPPPPSPSQLPTPQMPSESLPTIPDAPLVTFNAVENCSSDIAGGCDWTKDEKITIYKSAIMTGTALAEVINAAHSGWNLTAREAFLLVYGGSVNFQKMGVACDLDCWGRSTGANNINVYTNIFDGTFNQLVGDVKWAVHELGHSFVNATGSSLPVTNYEKLQEYGFANRGANGGCEFSTCGFAGEPWVWQRSTDGDAREEFADMYLGWVYGAWEYRHGQLTTNGYQRSSYMNNFMPSYVEMAINR